MTNDDGFPANLDEKSHLDFDSEEYPLAPDQDELARQRDSIGGVDYLQSISELKALESLMEDPVGRLIRVGPVVVTAKILRLALIGKGLEQK